MSDPPQLPPDWGEDTPTPGAGHIGTLKDHEQRLRKQEKCQRDTAASLTAIKAGIADNHSAIDAAAKAETARLRWIIGLAVGVLMTIGGSVATMVKFDAATGVELRALQQRQTREQARQEDARRDLATIRNKLTEVGADVSHIRTDQQRQIEDLEKDLAEHETRRRH